MNIVKTKDYAQMSKKAAHLIFAQVLMKPNCVLGLATGSTPIGTYKELIQWYEKGDLDFSSVTTVNLDEYKGISRKNEQSYFYFMNHHLFSHINIPPANTHIPDGMEPDSDKACNDYNSLLHSVGTIDLQLLGLGHNGHIGFNEPKESFSTRTHCVTLSNQTIDANKRFFPSIDDVPKQAYTMGIQTIMEAKKVVVIVNGEDKSSIVKQAFFGPITPLVPASILQLHPDCTLIADEAALSKTNI